LLGKGGLAWPIELPGGLLPAVNEAMPFRLVTLLRGVRSEPAGAGQVRVLLADYELRLLAPGGGEQLTPPARGRRRAWQAGLKAA